MQLNEQQMTWLSKLTKQAERQKENDERDNQKNAILEKFAEQREKNWDTILEGMQIKVGRIGKNGKFEAMDVWRKDGDQTKTFDLDEQRQGWRIAGEDGKGVEGGQTDDGELIEQPEALKHITATNLLRQITDEAHGAKITVKNKKGKSVEKPLFTDEELRSEIYDPLVRRGVPETFIGKDYSRTEKMVKGSFKAYKKRLEKEDLKGFLSENKDLGIALFRMGVSLPGNVTQSIEAVKLGVSQDQAGFDPIGNFQQAYGITANNNGTMADALEKTAQTWNFVQNLADIGFDGVGESIGTVGEVKEAKKNVKEGSGGEGTEEGEEDDQLDDNQKSAANRKKAVPALTRGITAAVAMHVSGTLTQLGPAGSTIFGSLFKSSEVKDLLGKDTIAEKDISDLIEKIAAAISETLQKLCPKGVDATPLNNAASAAKDKLAEKIKPAEIVKALNDGDFTNAISAFANAAKSASKAMTKALGKFVDDNAKEMKAKASKFVTDELTKADKPSKEDEKHKKEKGHEPDWVQVQDKPVCVRCQKETKDVNLFAGIIEQKILQMKKDEAIFKMIVNIGGLAFDVAANFLAPMAMGGALLRMMQWATKAVKKRIDFNNFCDSKKAMMNSASCYSSAIRRFRDEARAQHAHYSINAACEGVKIVAAVLQCTPAAVGGIIAAQAASGAEAVEAVIYEINKRDNLRIAWKTYKQALNNPENRKLGLVAIRKNPTLAKYAVAWGAVVEQDPLVSDFMSYCNLNADTVQGNANIDKVVEYLEARLPDDLVVVGRRYDETTADWAPDQVELTTDSWVNAKTLGETQGGVAKVDTGEIESALIKYDEALKKLDKAKSDKGKKIKAEATIKCLEQLKGALLRYFPKDAKNGGRVDEMWEVVELFLGAVETKIKALDALTV